MFDLDSINIRQGYVKFIIAETYFLIGFGYSFSAFIIPKLKEEPIFTNDDAIWIIISGLILKPVGNIICIYTKDSFGRRGTIRLKLLITCLGWIIITVSPHKLAFFIGRAVTSLGSGFVADNTAYISETCTEYSYSRSFPILFTVFGILGSNLIQYFFPWKIASFFAVIISLLTIFQTNCIPETRYWYLRKNRRREAILSSLWFQKDKNIQEIQEELNKVERSILTVSSNFNLSKILRNSLLIRSFIICLIVIATRTATGYFITSLFLVTFYESMGTAYNPEILAILTVFMNLAFFGISFSAINKYKSKYIFCMSTTVMIGVILTMTVYQHLFPDVKPMSWIPIAGMSIYLTINVTMYFPTISLMLTEFFSVSFKDCMDDLYHLLENVFVIIYTFAVYFGIENFRMEYVYFYFFLNALISLIVTVYFLPHANTSTHYEVIDFFENKLNSNSMDQQQLLQVLIDEESSN